MKVFRGYKVEIDPNNVQRTLLLKSVGVARFAYNWGLNEKKKAFALKTKVPKRMELSRCLNAVKRSEFPWMLEVSKWALQSALQDLDNAFERFFRRCKAKKDGLYTGKVGFPGFKSKRRGIKAFRMHSRIKVGTSYVQLPRLGKIRLKEHGYVPTEGVKLLSATVSEKAGRWFVSVNVEQEVPDIVAKPTAIVGVDLGIKTLATVSDGTTFTNPKALGSRLKKLKRLSRAVSRKQKGSNNRKKAVRRLARLHRKIANIRKDTLHKITTHLTKTKSCIGIEDLNVSGMMKNRTLARSLSDLGLYEFRRQLEYKAKWYGCGIAVADRFFPSSKKCHVCGRINDQLTLADRTWQCRCGAVHDRDFNASKNLEAVAVGSTETLNAYGGDLPLAVA